MFCPLPVFCLLLHKAQFRISSFLSSFLAETRLGLGFGFRFSFPRHPLFGKDALLPYQLQILIQRIFIGLSHEKADRSISVETPGISGLGVLTLRAVSI